MDIFEAATQRGGTYTEKRRLPHNFEARMKRMVHGYALRWGVGAFVIAASGFTVIMSFGLMFVYRDIWSDVNRLELFLFHKLEGFILICASFLIGAIFYLAQLSIRMDEFMDLLFEPTERTAQISPESDAMEATGANTHVSTIPYNTAQNSGHLPRRRGDVRVRGYLFFGALLDALQQGLTRDWLRDEWWPGYLERHPDTKYTFDYNAMRDALEAATFIYQPARNQGYKWTRAGKAWIEGAGYTSPPMEAGR